MQFQTLATHFSRFPLLGQRRRIFHLQFIFLYSVKGEFAIYNLFRVAWICEFNKYDLKITIFHKVTFSLRKNYNLAP
jgi:hypothetical protein